MKTTARELTRAIASGDTEAFAQLYEAHFDSMLAHARVATGRDEAFCLDIVQDAMMKVIRAIKPIDNDEALHAWLLCVVRTCAYDRLRRESRQQRRERDRGNVKSDNDTHITIERLNWLRIQLEELDPDSRHLIHLRHRLGWTLSRIGMYLNLSTGAVDGRLTRALRKLRARMEHIDD